MNNWSHPPPCGCQVDIFAGEDPSTVSHLNYRVPIKGIIPPTDLRISRRFKKPEVQKTLGKEVLVVAL